MDIIIKHPTTIHDSRRIPELRSEINEYYLNDKHVATYVKSRKALNIKGVYEVLVDEGDVLNILKKHL